MDQIRSDREEFVLTPVESAIFERAVPYLQVRDNELHTRNALTFSLRLLGEYEGRREIVCPAVILHDVGWSRLSEEQRARGWGRKPDRTILELHEKESAAIAGAILDEIGYDRQAAGEVLALVDGHDTRMAPFSLDDKIVKDADKLTRYGLSFWTVVRMLPISPERLAHELDAMVDPWFFLDLSRSIAREELTRRRLETP